MRKRIALLLSLVMVISMFFSTGALQLSGAAVNDDAVAYLEGMISLIPDTATKGDSALINRALELYNGMSEDEKALVTNYDKLNAGRKQLNSANLYTFKISCIGSSCTAGNGSSDASKYSYPAQLKTVLGDGYAVNNYGVPGTTIVHGAGTSEYITTTNYTTSLSSKPDAVVMFVGSNDATNSTWLRTDIDYPALFEKCYKELIETYKNLSTKPDIFLCYPYDAYSGDGRHDIITQSVIPLIDKLAAEYDLPVIDLFTPTSFGADWTTYFTDGIHPNDTGYRIVAESVAEAVQHYENARLADIKIDGQSIGNFNENLHDYGVVATDSIPAVTATAVNPGDTVTVTQATGAFPATATISVTSHAGKKVITNYRVTFGAENDISSELAAMKIAGIGVINADSKPAIESARAAYDSLSMYDRGRVINIDTLTSAETDFAAMEADFNAAKVVIDAINSIGEYDSADKTAAVKAAKAEYDKLTSTQKSYVTNYNLLKQMVNDIPNVDPVGYINEIIAAIPAAVTYHDGPAVREAMKVYATMSDEQKAQINGYSKISAASEALKNLYDVFSVTVGATDWNSHYSTTSPWLNNDNLSADDKTAILKAFEDEFKYQYEMAGYLLGTTDGAYNVDPGWGEVMLVQVDNGTNDNVGNPWSQASRYWAMLNCPFVGMAFSQNGYFGLSNYQTLLLGNSFEFDGKVYQMYWDGAKAYDKTPLVKDTSVVINKAASFPGANESGKDITNNTFRYAYAKYSQDFKWDEKTLGIPETAAVSDNGAVYQQFTGPDGVAFIAGKSDDISAAVADSGKPEGAFVVSGAAADALIDMVNDENALFAVTGLPTENATVKNGAIYQEFENGTLKVNSDGSYTFGDIVLVKKGDVNGDGTVTVSDIVELRKAIMTSKWTDEQLSAGDFDSNGLLSVSDVVSLRKYIMNGIFD